MVETSRMIVDGKEVPVERFEERDELCEDPGCGRGVGAEVGIQGNVAVLRRKSRKWQSVQRIKSA